MPEVEPEKTGHVLKRYTKDLAVPLSPEEMQARGERLAELQAALEQHDLETKQVNAARKSEKAAILADSGKVGLSLRQRTEVRAISCQEEADFKEGVVRIRRMDTGVLLSQVRPLKPEERQAKLSIDGEPILPRRAEKGEDPEELMTAEEIVAAFPGKRVERVSEPEPLPPPGMDDGIADEEPAPPAEKKPRTRKSPPVEREG